MSAKLFWYKLCCNKLYKNTILFTAPVLFITESRGWRAVGLNMHVAHDDSHLFVWSWRVYGTYLCFVCPLRECQIWERGIELSYYMQSQTPGKGWWTLSRQKLSQVLLTSHIHTYWVLHLEIMLLGPLLIDPNWGKD